MERAKDIHQMVKLDIKVILLMDVHKEKENSFGRMENIMKEHMLIIKGMEKEKYFIVMVKLNMMVILQMINVMDMENTFGKMEIII